MGSLNKAMIIGRLGRDPEVRYTQGGQAVASFSVATDHKWTNKSGEKQEKTEWHRIKAWGKLAELAGEYLAKGRQVYVEGRIETSEYTDKEGVKKYSTEIVANEIQFLDSKGEGASRRGPSSPSGGGPSGGGDEPKSAPAPEDDVPF